MSFRRHLVAFLLYYYALANNTKAYNLDGNNAIMIGDPSRQHNSYFGHSVLLRGEYQLYSASVIVGAPRANSSFLNMRRVLEPGQVYQCGVSLDTFATAACYPLFLDATGNTKDTQRGVKDRKDHAWIGASMDGRNNRNHELIVCAPRWVNQLHKNTYLNNGACYFLQDTLSGNKTALKLLPLIDASKQSFKGTTRDFYHYAFGEAGLSVHIMNNGSEVVLGAPGVHHWKGTVISYKYSNNQNASSLVNIHSVLIPNPYYQNNIAYDSYFGFNVNSGRFTDHEREWYVASAPRASNYKGNVYIFDLLREEEYSKREFRMIKEFQGTQMGEYFGYDTCAVDLNGDGLDDLIVGAPFFSTDHTMGDQGAVYVFINKGNWQFSEALQIVHKDGVDARFGHAIANVGDLDHDGFNDVVIGAPYENNGGGAIYVYSGSERGLKSTFTQRIAAIELSVELRGFGCSISRGVDVDANGFNDVAIGAYKSGHVVVIKSRPAIQVTVHTEREVLINSNNRVGIVYCLEIDQQLFDVNISTFLTIESPFSFKYINKTDGPVLTFAAFKSQMRCLNYSVEILFEPQYVQVVKPIEFNMTYWIDGQMNDAKINAMLNPYEDHSTFIYAIGVVAERPDLVVAAHFHHLNRTINTITIGQIKIVTLLVNVTNMRASQQPYMPRVMVDIPEMVTMSQLPSNCEPTHSTIVCHLQILGQSNSTASTEQLQMEVDLSNVPSHTIALKFKIQVLTASMDVNVANNVIFAHLKFNVQVKMHVEGQSMGDVLFLTNQNKSDDLSDFEVDFHIENWGHSAVDYFKLYVSVPTVYVSDSKEFVLFEIVSTNGFIHGQPVICEQNMQSNFSLSNEIDSLLAVANVDFNPPEIVSDDVNQSQNTCESARLKNTNYSVNRTMLVECDMDNVICANYRCTFGGALLGNALKQLERDKVHLKIAIKVLPSWHMDAVLGSKDIMVVSTVATTVPFINNKILGMEIIETCVYTTLLKSIPDEVVSNWLIFVSIIVGLLILLLIIVALIMSGFFVRNKKKHLRQLKQQATLHKQNDSLVDSSDDIAESGF